MRIDQRNNGASVVVANDNAYVVDRFRYLNSAGSVTCQQSAIAPTGFINSVSLTVGSTNTPGAADFQTLRHVIEGLNVADYAWGTASATPITISFWVRSSVTGTYSVGLRNSAVNRAYVATYSISVANTFEYKTITIPGDTSGTWLTTNGVGIYIDFSLGTGSNNEITAGSWQASSAFAATGEVNWISNAGATFYITGVQLEAGTTATPFERVELGESLRRCQRYYEVLTNDSNGYSILSSPLVSTANSWTTWRLKQTKRASPTVALFTGNSWISATPTISPSIDNVTFNATTHFYNQGAAGGVGITAAAEL